MLTALLLVAVLQVEEPPAAAPESTIHVEVAYTAWMTSLDFEATTATGAFRLDASTLQGVEVSGRWAFAEGWSARLGVDVLLGLDLESTGISLGAAHDLGFMDAPWRPYARAALVAGTFDVKDVPGSFKPAAGFEAAFGLARDLPEIVDGLSAVAELGFRYQSFAFDGDADVLTSDDTVGGFGLWFGIGAGWRF